MKIFVLAALFLSFSFNFGFAQESESVTVTIEVPEALGVKASAKNLSEKDKRTIAILGLQTHVWNTRLDASHPDKESELRAWLKQAVKNRFNSYAPSWRVKTISGTRKVEVSLVFANALFEKDYNKSAFGKSQSSDSSENSEAEKTIPLTSILIDEKTRNVFMLPVDTNLPQRQTNLLNSDYTFFHGRPFQASKAFEEHINSTSSQLSERLGAFTNNVVAKLNSKQTHVLNHEWSQKVAQFIAASAPAQGVFSESKTAWPPAIPFAASTLKEERGTILVFTVRNAERSGVLEKIDFIRFENSNVLRTYWSRSMNDPTLQETASSAISKVTAHFVKQNIASKTRPIENGIRIVVDRLVLEKEVVTVENIIRKISGQSDALLVPYEVTKADIRYSTPVSLDRLDKLVELVKLEAPNLHVRAIPGEGGLMQISPQSAGAKR